MTENGNIKISEDVISVLADKAIKEIEGVDSLAGRFADSIAVALGKKTAAGIDADTKDGKTAITVHLVIKYGYRIPEIAWKVQEAVKNTVETMTGLEVTKVNVCVDDVKFADETLPDAAGETAEDAAEEE